MLIPGERGKGEGRAVVESLAAASEYLPRKGGEGGEGGGRGRLVSVRSPLAVICCCCCCRHSPTRSLPVDSPHCY